MAYAIWAIAIFFPDKDLERQIVCVFAAATQDGLSFQWKLTLAAWVYLGAFNRCTQFG